MEGLHVGDDRLDSQVERSADSAWRTSGHASTSLGVCGEGGHLRGLYFGRGGYEGLQVVSVAG